MRIAIPGATSQIAKDSLPFLQLDKRNQIFLFAGNITKQPYFQGKHYRIVGDLQSTDIIMNRTFWIGVFPGLTEELLDYTVKQLETYFMTRI